MGSGAGRVAELDIRELLGGLDHEILMAEAVGEHDAAAGVNQLGGGVVALLTLRNTGLDNVLVFAQAQIGARSLGGVDEVLVIRGVFVVQADEAHLEIRVGAAGIVGLAATGAQCKHHDQGQQHCYILFHP